MRSEPVAHVGGLWGTGLIEISSDWQRLEAGGTWAVVIPFSGTPTFARFEKWSAKPPEGGVGMWSGVDPGSWNSSATRSDYLDQVGRAQSAIERGDVYQVNICRMLTAAVSEGDDIAALHRLLLDHNPAPYSALVRLPEQGLHVACASPELFIRREGARITSGPIKGTGVLAADLLDKDRAENVMIVDLVRNDLSRVAEVGSVEVSGLLETEQHPGLVHLVSYISARLRTGVTWADVMDATFPPGSIAGAPKSSALHIIDQLENAPRDIYCGAIGLVDVDQQVASLAVAIRTFWMSNGLVHFGTGAGITWGSDAEAEWRETELKAAHLCDVAAMVWQGDPS